jgi:hypothetical protein
MKWIILIFLFINVNATAQFEIIFGDTTEQCAATSILQLSSGNLVVASNNLDTSGINTVRIFKFDSIGNDISNTPLILNGLATVNRMKFSADGQLVLCGSYVDSTGTDALLIATDTAGSVLWYKTYGRQLTTESFQGLNITSEGNIALSGYTTNLSGSGNAFYFVVTDSAGEVIMENTYATTFNSYSDAVVPLPGNKFFLSGDRQLSSGNYTNAVVITDSLGNILHDSASVNPFNNGCKNDVLLSSGNILIVGESAIQAGGIFDPMIIKEDTAGNVLWSYIYNGDPLTTDALFDAVETANGGYITTGYGGNPATGSADMMVIAVDSNGAEKKRFYFGDSVEFDLGYSIITSSGGNSFFAAGTAVRNGINRGYIVSIRDSAFSFINENQEKDVLLYPNPANSIVHFNSVGKVSADIYNVFGIYICNKKTVNNSIDISDLEDGIYIIRVNDAGNTYCSRLSVYH